MTALSDDDFENILSIQNKCTRLNLNENIYGTFAEIHRHPGFKAGEQRWPDLRVRVQVIVDPIRKGVTELL